MATDTAAKYRSFHSLSSFLAAVRHAEEGPVDRRLVKVAAAALGSPSQEAVGADGGYIVPPEFLGFMRTVVTEESFLGLCTQRLTTSFSVNAWTDGQPPWSSSGPKPKRVVEAAAGAQTKPVLEGCAVPLHKLQVLIPATEELFDDAVGAQVYFEQTFRDRATFELNRWLLVGGGVAEPLGVLSSPATLTQTKESGPQTTDTIVIANLTKMMGKLFPRSRPRSIWCFSPSAWSYVEQNLVGPQGSTALDYSSDRPRLLGRPVFLSDAMQLIGDAGDVVLFDPTTVLAVTRPGGPKFDVSVGLWFDYGLRAFRATFRIGIASLWSAPVTAFRGSAQYSNAVTLEAR